MGIDYKRPEYNDNLPRWQVVDDTQKGEICIKSKGEKYLPFYGTQPRLPDTFDSDYAYNEYYLNYQYLTNEQKNRYKNYLKRAKFYNYVSRTVGGLVGMATKDALTISVDQRLEFVNTDINGEGMSLSQQYKRTTELTIKHARCGLLVDYPQTNGQVTQEQINQGVARSYCTLYKADQIINWGSTRFGAATKLSLVVLAEVQLLPKDGDSYELDEVTQYRVLRLVDGLYQQEVLADNGELIEGPYQPTDNLGNRLDFIPFQFVGAINNDADPDETTVYDIASLNVGHYINSADYENSSWLCGQPIPWISGVDQQWQRENAGLSLGSGAMIPVPQGGQFGIEQTQPNSQAFEAMSHKQDQMIALGAKMITGGGSFNSATEAAINNQSETSFLQSVIGNVTDAYQVVLDWMALFEGSGDTSIENPADLMVFTADPQMAAQVALQWQSGLISKEDARDYMRKIGTLERNDEEIDDLIDMDDSGLNLNGE